MPTLRQSPEGKTIYDCDICGRPWDHMSLAALCEAEGKPTEYPRGLIFGDHSEDSDLPDLTFAVAENNVIGHRNYLTCWLSWGSLRPQWDDLPPRRGSAVRSSPLGGIEGKIDLKHPGVAVLQAALEAVGIKPMIWDGRQPPEMAERKPQKARMICGPIFHVQPVFDPDGKQVGETLLRFRGDSTPTMPQPATTPQPTTPDPPTPPQPLASI